MAGEYIVARFTVPSSVTLSATNSGGGPTSVSITAGDYYIDELCAEIKTQLDTSRPPSSGEWVVTFSVSTGLVTIDCDQASGTWSITWTTDNLRTVLGFLANISAVSLPQTATIQARGFWRPNTGMLADSHPSIAPRTDDGRASVSPTGEVYKVAGTSSYRHRNIRYTHVPAHLVWADLAAVASPGTISYETFYFDTQAGLGFSWFTPASPCRVYWDNAGTLTQLGNGAVDGWKFPSPQTLDELVMPAAPWTGLVTIVLGDARSAG